MTFTNNLTITPKIPAKQGISGQKGANNYYDKSTIHLSRQYFPELKKACKMGVSGAKEVKFTTGLPLLQEEKIK
ncbi:MAG: hypothetical protein E7288_07600 [Lachnospiraceae bacterium]|nr:hypothetical protein [Lachnospiraceae bacterium]